MTGALRFNYYASALSELSLFFFFSILLSQILQYNITVNIIVIRN